MNQHVRSFRPEKARIAIWSPWGTLPKSRSTRPKDMDKFRNQAAQGKLEARSDERGGDDRRS